MKRLREFDKISKDWHCEMFLQFARICERFDFDADNCYQWNTHSCPIVKTTFRDLEHLEQNDYYNANLSFATRIEVIYDSIGREIALIGYNKALKLETKQTTEYLDNENAWLKKFYDSNSELVVNDCGVSIWYTRTNKPNGFEVERRYFDKNSMLVDCTHEDPELVYAYNVAAQIGNSNEWKMIYYTKKGKIVREFVFKTEE